MLSIQNKKNPKNKKLILVIAIVAIVILAVIAYIITFKPFSAPQSNDGSTRPANSVDYGPPTANQLKAAEEQKNEILQQNNVEKKEVNSSALGVEVSRADQASAGLDVEVRVLISGTKTGECMFMFTQNGQPSVQKTSSITYEATTSTCKTDIPSEHFSKNGDWKLTVKAVSGSSQGQAPEQVVMVVKV